MRGRFGKTSVWLLLGAALWLLPAVGFAQDAGKQDSTVKPESGAKKEGVAKYADKKVTLKVDTVRLNQAIRLLMNSVEADYVIDNALRNAFVTISMTDAPFEKVLKTVLKSSTIPVEYVMEEDVFHFQERTTPLEPEKPAAEEKKPDPMTELIPLENNTASRVMQFLFGFSSPNPVPPARIVGDNGSTNTLNGSRNYNGFGFDNGKLTFSNYQQTTQPNGRGSTTTRSGGIFGFDLNTLFGMFGSSPRRR